MSTLAPAEEAAIAQAIGEARARATPLLLAGHATKDGVLRPVQAETTLSLKNHAGVTLYAPNELIISARAGTTLAEIEALVASAGQQIIAEPPDLTALLGTEGAQTLGGVVACNLSGPRRVTAGAMRDHVMGLRAVNGAGEIIRAGGRVLKNVTGLDLCKLLTGSFGTLAAITEITLKVLPAAETMATLVLLGRDARGGVAALSAALGAPFGASAAAWLPRAQAERVAELAPFAAAVALVRVEDFRPSVSYRGERLRALLTEFGAAEIFDEAASRAVWRAVRDAAPLGEGEGNDAVWRVSVRPSAGPDIVAVVETLGGRCFLDWGGGLAWIAAEASAATHRAITQAARAAGGVWWLMRAPAALRASLDVVPAEPAPLAAIARRVKAAFDPAFILNPGRIHAGL